MRPLKTARRPPIYPKTPGHLPCSSLTHPLPLPSRRPSVSFGGFGVRGINVFPSAIAAVLSSTAPEATGEFQVVLAGPGPYDHLDITVEHGGFDDGAEPDALSRRIEEALRDTLSFGATVTLVGPDAIPRTEMGKAARVARRY